MFVCLFVLSLNNNNNKIMEVTPYKLVRVNDDGSFKEEVLTRDIWLDRKVVCCFLRHFGCRFCHQQLAGLNSIYDKLKSADPPISLVAIGFGNEKEAKDILEKVKFKGELYVDRNENEPLIYKVFRLKGANETLFTKDGPSKGLRPEVAKLGQAALDSGFTDGKADKDMGILTRVGGCFVLGPGNTCDYAHRSRFAGDHAPLDEVLCAATGMKDNDTSYTYPSTEAWVKRLGGTKRYESSSLKRHESSSSGEDEDAAYLESLRKDAEGRVESKGSSYGTITFVGLLAIFVVLGLFIARVYPAMFETERLGTVLCTSVAAFLLAFFFLKNMGRGEAVKVPRKKEEKKEQEDLKLCPAALKLLTPKSIDKLAADLNNLQCDCGFVDLVDVESKVEEEERGRARTESAMSEVGEPLGRMRSMSIDEVQEAKIMMEMNCYLREFLAKPHPLVGRKGPVCPFVPGSLRMDAMYVSVIKTGKKTSQAIAKVKACARQFVTRFHELEPQKGRKAAYKAVVLIFPDVPLHKAPKVIDDVQSKLKPDFVAKGLMIGEFHLRNNACGLRNESFYPLRTPHPAIAIRRIVPTDLVFLTPTKYPVELRKKFLNSYLEQFEDDSSASAKKAVADARKLLKECK